MTNIKNTVLMLLVLLGSIAAKADTVDPYKRPIQVQIREHLKEISFDENTDKGIKVMITFTVTSKNEIVVISTNNKKWDSTLKSTLNYKVVNTDLDKYQVYSIPLTIN